MFVSVVVPCYRSAATLPSLVGRLATVLPTATAGYEVVLVVDGSPDDTWDVARELALHDPTVRAIRLARNYGQHNALIAGVRAARYDVVVTMDDDLQHLPEQVPTLLAALTDDVDLVYGVAAEEEHGPLRSFASRFVKAGIAGGMGVGNARVMSAFRAFRTLLRQSFDLVRGPDVSVDVSLSWGTTRVAAVTVPMARRAQGRSGYTLRSLVRYSVNMTIGYSTAPLRLVTFVGFIVGLGGVALFIRLLWSYLHGQTTIAGFTTIASMVAVFSSALMIGLGVLGEYVGRIHAGGMGRPTYVIRERAQAPVTAEDGDLAQSTAGLSETVSGTVASAAAKPPYRRQPVPRS